MHIFPINGNAMAGKDTFAGIMFKYTNSRCISSVDKVKEFYCKMGWDGIKTDLHRKNLNTLKYIWIDACNGPYEWVTERCHKFKEEGVFAVFVMVREFEEMINYMAISKQYSDVGGTIRIIRPHISMPPIEKSFLDSHPDDYVYDFTIINPSTKDKTLPKLHKAAEAFATAAVTRTTKLVWNPWSEKYEISTVPTKQVELNFR